LKPIGWVAANVVGVVADPDIGSPRNEAKAFLPLSLLLAIELWRDSVTHAR
jgi:hypothetical protein